MYLVLEIQTNEDGQTATIITQHETQHEAESKYHTVLAAAAISSVAHHSAVLLYHLGNVLMSESYSHETPETAQETTEE